MDWSRKPRNGDTAFFRPDTGIGIPADKLRPRSFFRSIRSTLPHSPVRWHGLGRSIASRLVQQMGGASGRKRIGERKYLPLPRPFSIATNPHLNWPFIPSDRNGTRALSWTTTPPIESSAKRSHAIGACSPRVRSGDDALTRFGRRSFEGQPLPCTCYRTMHMPDVDGFTLAHASAAEGSDDGAPSAFDVVGLA